MKMEMEKEKYKETELQEKISKIEELLREIKESIQKEELYKKEIEEESEEEVKEVEGEKFKKEREEVVREEKQVTKTALKNPWFYVSVIAVIIVILLVYKIMVPTSAVTGKVVYNNPNNNIAVPSENVEKVSVSIDDDAMLGNKNAQVTIIEFSDYECPFCARFYLNTLPQLKREYIDTGKVKLIYRDFPLSFHQNAQKAAEAAEAAKELGGNKAYWKMHDKIFENQQAISEQGLVKYAKEIGLNETKFKEILTLSKYRNEVLQDFADGQEAGVQGTPTFFINGKPLAGVQPFEAFKQIIEEELK